MREDEYLSLTQPHVLLDRTGHWSWICSGCQRSKLPERRCRLCGGSSYDPPSERKLRLIACACVRFCRDELGEDVSAAVLEAAERWGEGDTSGWSLLAGLNGDSPLSAVARLPGRDAAGSAIRFALRCSRSQAPHRLARSREERMAPALAQADRAARAGAVTLDRARQSIIRQFRLRDQKEVERLLADDRRRLCDVIRDVLGNPYRPVTVKPAWLDANRNLARTIATEMDAEGRFEDLPILADALEDGGCDDERILSHARQPRHYRGCWLIDAILDRK